ncbi:hypothetical protein ACRYCC_26230 [Actinomadura scrupuli]|uniref:hypothetical protein n=1 Tax=Actinomadura scrupuli TaxID=559629 RepID=UPI003D9881EF
MAAPGEEQLLQTEQQAAAASDAAFDRAVGEYGLTAAALAAAAGAVTAAITAAVAQAVQIGAVMAGAAAVAAGVVRSRRRRRRGRPSGTVVSPAARHLLQGPTIGDRVDSVLADADLEDAEDPAAELERIKGRLRTVATDTVNEAASAGVEDEARRLSADGLIWKAERDGCVHCLGLSGHIVPLGEGFPADMTFGAKPLTWRHYDGLPPRHPHCRCRTAPVFGSGEAQSAALKREAMRSVLRGFSLPSESKTVRLAAADRLLRSGRARRLPKTAVALSRRAVSQGEFPKATELPPTRRAGRRITR